MTMTTPAAVTRLGTHRALGGRATDLSGKAMLVKITCRRYQPTKTNKRVTREVQKQRGLGAKSGKWDEHLIDPDHLRPVQQAMDALRAENYLRTLPWRDGGWRVLPAAGYFDYLNAIRPLVREVEDAIADFRAKWPQYVEEARVGRGADFRAQDYPTASQLAAKFEVGYRIDVLPSANDFRVDLGVEEFDACVAAIEMGVKADLAEAMKDNWASLKEVVEAMVERLTVPTSDADGKTVKTFRDTLVENVRRLCAVLPSLNLTDDPALEVFTDRVRTKLGRYDAEALREDIDLRKDVAAEAQRILDAMKDYA